MNRVSLNWGFTVSYKSLLFYIRIILTMRKTVILWEGTTKSWNTCLLSGIAFRNLAFSWKEGFFPRTQNWMPVMCGSTLTRSITGDRYFTVLFHTTCCVELSMGSNSVTPWTVAHQAFLSMRFSRQEYWSGLPFPTPWDLPNPRIKPSSPASPALAGRFFTTEPPRKP